MYADLYTCMILMFVYASMHTCMHVCVYMYTHTPHHTPTPTTHRPNKQTCIFCLYNFFYASTHIHTYLPDGSIARKVGYFCGAGNFKIHTLHTYVHTCMHTRITVRWWHSQKRRLLLWSSHLQNIYTTYIHTCMHAYTYTCPMMV
jgi:hypothetical protein